jgi:hypothetical protein
VTSHTDLPTDLETARQEIKDLRQALESRSVIDQAKGLVRAWLCCDEEEAFAALTRASQNANVKLRVLAQDVVGLASDCTENHDDWMAQHIGPRGATPPSEATAV